MEVSQPIKLSSLGRQVQPGDMYNYFTDTIVKNDVVLPEECKPLPGNIPTKVERHFILSQQGKFRHVVLGINSHLRFSIETKSLDANQLWFSSYMKTTPIVDGNNVAEVSVLFRVFLEKKTLAQHFFDSHMICYQKQSGGRATHVVQEVDYGVELICTIQKQFNPGQENKSDVEETICMAAKAYFNQQKSELSKCPQPPVELENVSCEIISSLHPEHVQRGSFRQAGEWIHDAIFRSKERRAIEIVLRYIPAQLETKMNLDKLFDSQINQEKWNYIVTESRLLKNHSITGRIPQLEKAFCFLYDLLSPAFNLVEKSYVKSITEPQKNFGSSKIIESEVSSLPDLLIDWLKERRDDIEMLRVLLGESKLNMLDLVDIDTRVQLFDNIEYKVILLKFDLIEDPLIDRICQIVGKTSDFKRPIFPIIKAEKNRLSYFSNLIRDFSMEASHFSSSSKSYLIGLLPLHIHGDDGDIRIVKYSSQQMKTYKNTPVSTAVEGSSETKTIELIILESTETGSPEVAETWRPSYSNSLSFPLSKAENSASKSFEKTPVSLTNIEDQQNSTDVPGPIVAESENKDTNYHQPIEADKTEQIAPNARRETKCENSATLVEQEKLDRHMISDGDRITNYSSESEKRDKESNSKEVIHKENNHVLLEKSHSTLKEDGHQSTLENAIIVKTDVDIVPSKSRRVCEIFADVSSQLSQLTDQRKPDVYLLNAVEQSVSADLRWFNIGKPKAVPHCIGHDNHKVILLMGATGCGKSTLINGMFNYILGVEYQDSFRFKVVREDESSVGRNQADSQTSSVTAYTLPHQAGMAVTYSITIIDTPGYGDTRGVERDKEITRTIHRFLSQPELRLDRIHAACFVAASGDSRLTTTQRYILDSVLSIFGKDFKDNIRLLVTFADNADSPVVEACLAAHFPVKSVYAGLTYSKFNSSVLYTSNKKCEEDDFSFNELFWEMGQENFQKFFVMLEGMNGQDLTSTREVIQHRQKLEQSFKDIERELESCLDSIENMEMFQRKIIECKKMEDTRNYTVETKQVKIVQKIECDKGFKSYNCCKCRKTCERRVEKVFKKRKCHENDCSCQASQHKFDDFEYCPVTETVIKTLSDMNAEFESSYGDKMSTEELLESYSEKVDIAKGKVLSLLDQMEADARSLDSTALRSNALSPADHLSFITSKVLETQTPGYLTRLKTLEEIRQYLDGNPTGQSRIVKSAINSQSTSGILNVALQSRGRGRGLLTGSCNSNDGLGTPKASVTNSLIHQSFNASYSHGAKKEGKVDRSNNSNTVAKLNYDQQLDKYKQSDTTSQPTNDQQVRRGQKKDPKLGVPNTEFQQASKVDKVKEESLREFSSDEEAKLSDGKVSKQTQTCTLY